MSLEFRCSSVGVTDCKAVTHAETEEELLELVIEHARDWPDAIGLAAHA